MRKDAEIRAMIDVRKYNSHLSGSPLFAPKDALQSVKGSKPTCTWSLGAVAIGKYAGPYVAVAKTVLLIAGGADGGSVTFNIETHTVDWITPDTDLMSSDLVVDSTGEFQTAFALATIPAGCWVWLDVSDFSGTIAQCSISLVAV